MELDWQRVLSLLIVGGAAVMLARSRFVRRRFRFQREGHCGCSAVATSAPKGSIVFRARKGERHQVQVKMK